MKKALTAIAAVTALAVVSLAPSDAEAGRRGRGVAPLLGGLAAGALIGGAIVSSQQPAYGYYGYGPGPVYVAPPERFCEDWVWSNRRGDYVLRRFPC